MDGAQRSGGESAAAETSPLGKQIIIHCPTVLRRIAHQKDPNVPAQSGWIVVIAGRWGGVDSAAATGVSTIPTRVGQCTIDQHGNIEVTLRGGRSART